jgi:hypothetical protein
MWEREQNQSPTFATILPGPDRKRQPARYRYRLVYHNPDQAEPGCLLLWEVSGGRVPYQIAIEREESGEMRSHCTCPDAVYRDDRPGHTCKHVRGFLHLGQILFAGGDGGLRRDQRCCA